MIQLGLGLDRIPFPNQSTIVGKKKNCAMALEKVPDLTGTEICCLPGERGELLRVMIRRFGLHAV